MEYVNDTQHQMVVPKTNSFLERSHSIVLTADYAFVHKRNRFKKYVIGQWRKILSFYF